MMMNPDIRKTARGIEFVGTIIHFDFYFTEEPQRGGLK